MRNGRVFDKRCASGDNNIKYVYIIIIITAGAALVEVSAVAHANRTARLEHALL